MPIVDKNGWWKAKEKKENHLRLILGIKGIVPMNMGRTHNDHEKRDGKNKKSPVTKEVRNGEFKGKEERKK